MIEEQTTYATTKQISSVPQEPTGYRAIGRAVYAEYGDDAIVMICECYVSSWRGLTYKQACEQAEQIAEMKNQMAAI